MGEPSYCRCPTNSSGDIQCHNCGEWVNKRCWNCGTPRGDGPCPTRDASPATGAGTAEDGSEAETSCRHCGMRIILRDGQWLSWTYGTAHCTGNLAREHEPR